MGKFDRDDSIKLGDRCKDEISGLVGVVVAICEWLNGCRRITIQPEALFEGKPVASQTFDAEQVSKIEEGPEMSASRTGGPSISPMRNIDPGR